MTSTRVELLKVLEELSDVFPQMRVGQLVTNLAYQAVEPSVEAAWEVEDNALLLAARDSLNRNQGRTDGQAIDAEAARESTLTRLHDLLDACPFVPFAIQLIDGGEVPVEDRSRILVSTTGQTIVVIQSNDKLDIVSPGRIAALEACVSVESA